jgi:hypothetical protein
MEIGYQVVTVLIFIGVLLGCLYFIRKKSDLIRSMTHRMNGEIRVKESTRIDLNCRLTLVSISEKEYLLLTSKSGHNCIHRIE